MRAGFRKPALKSCQKFALRHPPPKMIIGRPLIHPLPLWLHISCMTVTYQTIISFQCGNCDLWPMTTKFYTHSQDRFNTTDRWHGRETPEMLMWHTLHITGMVVAYSIMGGFLFQALEAPYEYRMKLGIKQWKEEKITEIWQLSSQLNTGMMENSNFTAAVRKIFLDFQERVTVAVKDKVFCFCRMYNLPLPLILTYIHQT